MKNPAFRFYPSDFWASPDVQAMELNEVGAYLSLLSAAWLSERPGCLPDDDDKLRKWARMPREQWEQSRKDLLSKFPIVEVGWRQNPRLFHEAEKSAAYTAAQSANGKKGGRPKAGDNPRLSSKKPRVLPGLDQKKPSVSVSVSKKEQKPSRDKPEADNKHARFQTLIAEYWSSKNEIDMPWGPADGKQLSVLISTSPKLTDEGFTRLLEHRKQSVLNHSDPPFRWLNSLTRFAGGPLDQFGNPQMSPKGNASATPRPANAMDKLATKGM